MKAPKGFVPKAPAHVTATGVAPDAIQVTWTASAGAFAYTVYRSTSPRGPFTHPLAGIAAGIIQGYYDSGLTPDTTYYYVVTASNAAGESIQSSPPTAGTTLLVAPTGVQAAAAGSTGMTVYWQPAGSAITSHTICRSTSASGHFDKIGTLTTAQSTSPSYGDTGLSPGTTYYYQVSAATANNHSLPSTPPASGTTGVDPPTGVIAQPVSSTSVEIKWNPSPGATYYAVYIDGPTPLASANFVGTSNSTSCTDTNVPRGTMRCYRVLAGSGAAAVSGLSGPPACATTPWVTPPNMVGARAISAHTIRVMWSAAPGATTYTVSRSTVQNSTDPNDWTDLARAVSPFDDDDKGNGLTSNTTYYYKIKASDNGHMSESTIASATTLLNEPTNVQTKTTSATADVQITWSAVAGATGYTVWRSPSALDSFGKVNSSPVPGQQLTDSRPQTAAGATFFYEVSASNIGNTSLLSTPPVPATLPPASPGNFMLNVSNGGMTVSISWTTPPGTGWFNVYRSSDSTLMSRTLVTTIMLPTTSFSSLMPNVWYGVTAANFGGESAIAGPAVWTGAPSH